MILRVTGSDLAKRATTGGYSGLPYTKLDCQAFVEQVLRDTGVRKPDGSAYNWKGSNSMWRNHVKWKGTIEECRKKFGDIPLGAFVFLVKQDGGEEGRGYHDGQGNASHVGLYVGSTPLPVMDSSLSRGYVSCCKLDIFTHVALMVMVDYYTEPVTQSIETPLDAVRIIRDEKSKPEDVLKAMEILTNHLREVQ